MGTTSTLFDASSPPAFTPVGRGLTTHRDQFPSRHHRREAEEAIGGFGSRVVSKPWLIRHRAGWGERLLPRHRQLLPLGPSIPAALGLGKMLQRCTKDGEKGVGVVAKCVIESVYGNSKQEPGACPNRNPTVELGHPILHLLRDGDSGAATPIRIHLCSRLVTLAVSLARA